MVKMSERRAERRAHLDSKPKPIPETNERSLRQAAALGDMEKLQQLLKADGVDVNDRDVTAASHYPHRSPRRADLCRASPAGCQFHRADAGSDAGPR